MFCGNNSWGSCSWIIIIIILLFACGGSCGQSANWNGGCGCNQNSGCGC